MTQNYVLTLIANPKKVKLATPLVKGVSEMCKAAGFRIAKPDWLATDIACDIKLMPTGDAPDQRFANMMADAIQLIDVVVQPDTPHRKKKLLLSDMDSTIIQQECIDELAAQLGLRAKVSEITDRAMRGELDFKEALRERVKLLKGFEVAAMEAVYENQISITPGAKTLIATMKAGGAKCVLVSGGFTFFTGKIRDALGFDMDSANILAAEDSKLTGEVVEPILDKDAKLKTLKDQLHELDLPVEASMAVGDGANDLPMIQGAGLGVAYHAKPVVAEQAKASIIHTDLTSLLYIQGYRHRDIVRD